MSWTIIFGSHFWLKILKYFLLNLKCVNYVQKEVFRVTKFINEPNRGTPFFKILNKLNYNFSIFSENLKKLNLSFLNFFKTFPSKKSQTLRIHISSIKIIFFVCESTSENVSNKFQTYKNTRCSLFIFRFCV